MIMHLIPEGHLEEAVGSRLILACGHSVGTIYNRGRGCDYIREKAARFHWLATDVSGVLVLTNFRDAKAPCLPAALHAYIGSKAPTLPKSFVYRFAVAELESWFLADRQGLAKFLGVSAAKMPQQPKLEPFPKTALINIARTSQKSRIREGIAPPRGHRASVGPEYMAALRNFAVNHWNIEAARVCSPSLNRCVQRLCELASG
jgi:hypothetical protein